LSVMWHNVDELSNCGDLVKFFQWRLVVKWAAKESG